MSVTLSESQIGEVWLTKSLETKLSLEKSLEIQLSLEETFETIAVEGSARLIQI